MLEAIRDSVRGRPEIVPLTELGNNPCMDALLHTLQALESELHHASHLCPRSRLEALLHPQFHEVDKSGVRYARETVIRYLSQITRAAPSRALDHAAQLLAPGCALLTYAFEHGQQDGTVQRALRCSIWIQEGGTWQLIYHQGTPA